MKNRIFTPSLGFLVSGTVGSPLWGVLIGLQLAGADDKRVVVLLLVSLPCSLLCFWFFAKWWFFRGNEVAVVQGQSDLMWVWFEGFDAGERDAFDLDEHPEHECTKNPYLKGQDQ